jgi:hypothetical protein
MKSIILIEDLLENSETRLNKILDEGYMDDTLYDSEEEYIRDMEFLQGKVAAYRIVLDVLKNNA